VPRLFGRKEQGARPIKPTSTHARRPGSG
jgi:hypothetical protein